MANPKQRSPNYPAIGIGEAIDLIKRLYRAETRGAFPPESSAKAWGYKSYSGPVRSKFSALKQFGLIEQKKGQAAKLSERALTIALRNEASKEYGIALKETALEPPLFREFYEQDRLQSSDDTLKHELIVNRRFTDDGAVQFIETFRATMTIAGLTERGIMSGYDRDKSSSESEGKMTPIPQAAIVERGDEARAGIPASQSKAVFIISGGSTFIRLELPLPMSKARWEQIKKTIETIEDDFVERARD